MKLLSSLVLATLVLLSASVLRAAQVTVFAAASLTDALKEIGALYETNSSDTVVFNFAASGPLARQIEAGAPADIFISADQARADALAAKGLLVDASRRNLLGNVLVLVTPLAGTGILAPADLTNAAVKHIALGDMKSVPCGTYAQKYLVQLGLWPVLAPKVIPCESVRSVLATVETGNVDAGVVYRTDAAISKKVKVVYEVPASAAPDITYPAALVKQSPSPVAAAKFLDYLSSDAATEIFRRYGFIIPTTAPAK
jgi:molybdate transport system substrate-binding protein